MLNGETSRRTSFVVVFVSVFVLFFAFVFVFCIADSKTGLPEIFREAPRHFAIILCFADYNLIFFTFCHFCSVRVDANYFTFVYFCQYL